VRAFDKVFLEYGYEEGDLLQAFKDYDIYKSKKAKEIAQRFSA